MKDFLTKDFLLNTEAAKKLFHEAAEACPIIDYHCHLSPKEIWEDIRYDNITQVWLGGDHYKWRLMRSAGVSEKYITGDAPDYEKFLKYATVLGRAVGNPLYHWSHLELRRFFGYEGILNEKTAPEVWEIANAKLRSEGYSARGLIRMSNVAVICTTDDPVDSLEYHEKLAADNSFPVTVLPAWRPDKAMNLEKETWTDYIAQLGKAAGIEIRTFADLKKALHSRLDHFEAHGCKLSDHGLNYVMYAPAAEERVEEIFAARMAGKLPDAQTEAEFKTACMMFLSGEYFDRNWVSQLHYGCRRDNNPVRLCGQHRAFHPDRRVPWGAGGCRKAAENDPVQPEHQRQRSHRYDPGMFPERYRGGTDPARFRLVVQRPFRRNDGTAEVPRKPGLPGRICGHADRQPLFPELSAA